MTANLPGLKIKARLKAAEEPKSKRQGFQGFVEQVTMCRSKEAKRGLSARERSPGYTEA
jgi:hypothetical protein